MKILRSMLLIAMAALILGAGGAAKATAKAKALVACPDVIWIDPVTGQICRFVPFGNTCKKVCVDP